MKKSLSLLTSGLLLSATALTAAPIDARNLPDIPAKFSENTNSWNQMLRAKALRESKDTQVPAEVRAFVANLKAKSPSLEPNTPDAMKGSDAAGWIALPQNQGYWFYAINYTYGESNSITGFKLTIYNNKYEKVSTINGLTPIEGNETRIVQVDVSDYITKKYYKNDDNYEIAINIAANTSKYVNNYRTIVYSINPAEADNDKTTEPLLTIPGLIVDVTDATDTSSAWASEKHYFTYLQEGYIDTDENFTLGSDDTADVSGQTPVMQFKVVKSAGYSDYSIDDLTIKTFNVPTDLATYTSGVNFLAKYDQTSKQFYFGPVYYSKPYLNDKYQYDETGDEPFLTPDNTFDTNLWKIGGYGDATEVGTVSIPCDAPTGDGYGIKFTLYSVGLLEYTDDLKVGLWTPAGEPSLTITTEEADFEAESYPTSYKVYNLAGEVVKTLAENTSAAWLLNDVDGYPTQCVFGEAEGDDQIFRMVDLDANASTVVTLNASTHNGNSLTNSLDRVPVGNGYNYVVALADYETNADGIECKVIDWIDEDGVVVHHDLIDAGGENMGILPNITQNALVPYLYTTDDVRAYACFVKRRQANGTIITSLAIIDSNNNVLFEQGPKTEYGNISSATIFNTPGNKAMWITYSGKNGYTCELYQLPLKAFAGGEGTAENPYVIASAGDLALVQGYPTSHFVVSKDIDCSAITLSAGSELFTGSFDGQNHVLSNIKLNGKNPALFGKIEGATIKDVNISNASIDLSSNTTSALLATVANYSTISNVHVYGLAATSETNDCTFGGLVGELSAESVMTECSVEGADISLTNDWSENVGGLVGKLTASASVHASAFSGSLTGYMYVGGIVGTSVAPRSADESTKPTPNTISNCHVNATISGANTIGGIIGTTGSINMTNNYVEGTVSGTEASNWSGPRVGGLIGNLDGFTGDVKTITGNVVNLSAINYTPSTREGEWANQFTTVHRIVGSSVYNENPDWYENLEETALDNNYAVSTLAVIDTTTGAGATTTEGADLAEINKTVLTELGWAYGTTKTAPWCEEASALPHLYYEELVAGIVADASAVEIKVNDVITVTLTVVGGSSDDVEVSCDNANVSVEVISNQGNTIAVNITGESEGTATVVATAGTHSATIAVTVVPTTGVENISTSSSTLTYDGSSLHGEGIITVYNLSGVVVAQGTDTLPTDNLTPGVYVATSANGTLKIGVN